MTASRLSSDDDPEPSPVERLARQCAFLADRDFRGYSPLYERQSRQIATDPALLAMLVDVPGAGRLPVNLFAAVHFLARREPASELARIYRGEPGDPWPPFRQLLVDRFDDVVEILRTRTIQTNEVGRTATLVPAFTATARRLGDPSLALVEIGPSAGLNLLFDRYRVTYSDGRAVGPVDATVQVRCDLLGPAVPPLPDDGLALASREGIDLAPVDVRDRDACEWLEACLWPDVPGRLARFEAAVEVARAHPTHLHRGDALELLPSVLERVPAHDTPLVFTTWALAYFDKAGRQAVHDIVGECGRNRDLALVTAEFEHVTPWMAPAPRPPTLADRGATFVSLATWRAGIEECTPLAWTHSHGAWLDWFEPSTPVG